MPPLRPTLAVFRKELRDGLRDRRSLASALSYSLMGPLLMALALTAVARGDADRPLTLAVAGAGRAPSLVRFLEQERVRVRPAADPAAALRAGGPGVVLVVPEGYAEDFRRARPARVEIRYHGARSEARAAAARARALLEAYGRRTAELRLLARGMSPRVARPLEIAEADLSPASPRALAALATLPIFLLLAAFVGSMNTAIDATAGERERRSLESLLVHPVPRMALAAGKWLAAVALSALAVALTLAVTRLVLESERVQELGLRVGLDGRQALALFAALLPLALFAPAAQMLIALFSRSFKEAQTYLSLFLFVPMLPGFFFAFGTVREEPWMDWTPLVGQQLLLGRLLRGEGVAVPAAAGLAAATAALALACVLVTARLLRHERIVLGR